MEKIKFYGLLDFYPNKEEIKKEYDLLTYNEIAEYKLYVYSLPFIEDDVKDLIWEYLNGDWGIDLKTIFELSKKYRIKKERNDKRQELYDKEKYESDNTIKTI